MTESQDPNPWVIRHTDNPNAQSTRDPAPPLYLPNVTKGDKFVYSGPEINEGMSWRLLPNTMLVVDDITQTPDYLMIHGDGQWNHTWRWYSARELWKMMQDGHLHKVPRELYRNITAYYIKNRGRR